MVQLLLTPPPSFFSFRDKEDEYSPIKKKYYFHLLVNHRIAEVTEMHMIQTITIVISIKRQCSNIFLLFL